MSSPALTKDEARNQALIVSVEKFHPWVGLVKRLGARRDTKRLHRILCQKGFHVTILTDPDANEILEAFKDGKDHKIYTLYVCSRQF